MRAMPPPILGAEIPNHDVHSIYLSHWPANVREAILQDLPVASLSLGVLPQQFDLV
jgi:hypothetical protein